MSIKYSNKKKRTALCEKIRFYKKNTDNQYPRENEGSLQCNPDRLWAKLKVHFCCLCLFPSNVQQQRTTFCKIADLRNGLVHIGKPTTVHFKLQQQYTEMPTAHSLRMHGQAETYPLMIIIIIINIVSTISNIFFNIFKILERSFYFPGLIFLNIWRHICSLPISVNFGARVGNASICYCCQVPTWPVW